MVLSPATIRVVHGTNEDRLPLVGLPISTIKRSLRDIFNIPYFAEALVDGVPVDAEHVLHSCAVLEFVKTFGSKGGQGLGSPEVEAEGLLGAYQDQISQIGDLVKAMKLEAPESVDKLVELFTHWCQRKFGPICNMDLPQVTQVLDRLGQMVLVSAEMQRLDSCGKPGRRTTTDDIARFAHLRRSGINKKSWKDIYAEWKRENPDDDRANKAEDVREAYRRHFGDKARI